MNNLQKIKEAVWKANPSILERNEWKPMYQAPKTGWEILGLYDVAKKETYVITWQDHRTCMLGGAQGSCGAGWEDVYNKLPVDAPLAWCECDNDDNTIHLADILLAIKSTKLGPMVMIDCNGSFIGDNNVREQLITLGATWNLLEDDLDKNPQCWDFIAGLLNKE